jgi:hypothetical protein
MGRRISGSAGGSRSGRRPVGARSRSGARSPTPILPLRAALRRNAFGKSDPGATVVGRLATTWAASRRLRRSIWRGSRRASDVAPEASTMDMTAIPTRAPRRLRLDRAEPASRSIEAARANGAPRNLRRAVVSELSAHLTGPRDPAGGASKAACGRWSQPRGITPSRSSSTSTSHSSAHRRCRGSTADRRVDRRCRISRTAGGRFADLAILSLTSSSGINLFPRKPGETGRHPAVNTGPVGRRRRLPRLPPEARRRDEKQPVPCGLKGAEGGAKSCRADRFWLGRRPCDNRPSFRDAVPVCGVRTESFHGCS